MNTATYYDKTTNEVISGNTLLKRATSKKIDVANRPPVEFKFDDSVIVKPQYFQTVKILWKTHTHKDQETGEEISQKYPDGDSGPSEEKIKGLK